MREVHVPLSVLLAPFSWRLYRWVDSFIDELSRLVDLRVFLGHVQWETIAALRRIEANAKALASKRGEVRRDGHRPLGV